jgi:hypothetical protein
MEFRRPRGLGTRRATHRFFLPQALPMAELLLGGRWSSRGSGHSLVSQRGAPSPSTQLLAWKAAPDMIGPPCVRLTTSSDAWDFLYCGTLVSSFFKNQASLQPRLHYKAGKVSNRWFGFESKLHMQIYMHILGWDFAIGCLCNL